MTRKINGAQYEYNRVASADLLALREQLAAGIVEGKAKDLDAATRKQNGVLRRKMTNIGIVLNGRCHDEAGRRASAQVDAEGIADRAAEYQRWHDLRLEIAGTLVAGVDY